MSHDKFAFRFYRDASARWVYVSSDGTAHEDVQVVRAFPITDPLHGISIVSADGHEVLWLDTLDDLSEDVQQQISDALSSREFMPEIVRITDVSTFATPSVWTVTTNRGETSFTLKGEEDIRRLTGQMFLINDRHGIHYLIRDTAALDKQSRRLLDRFL